MQRRAVFDTDERLQAAVISRLDKARVATTFQREHVTKANSIEWAMPPPEPPKLPPKAPAVTRPDGGQGAVVVERKTAKTKPPRMFQVVMLNDDYTPMEFVVMVLQQTFKRDIETATQIMLKIHHEGRGVCGVYSKDVAATKVELVLAAARRAGHPLQCIMEAA